MVALTGYFTAEPDAENPFTPGDRVVKAGDDVVVNIIDAFQGSEREATIISLVLEIRHIRPSSRTRR